MGPNTEDDDKILEDLEEQYLDEDFYKDFINDDEESDDWIEDFLER